MKLNFRQLAVATAIACSSAGAFAAPTPISLGTNPVIEPLVGYGSTYGTLTFSYTFTLDSVTDFSKFWGELRPTDPADFVLTLTGPGAFTSTQNYGGTPLNPIMFSWDTLADGDYMLDIVATPNSSTFTAYGGFAASAVAVPEPETYALALAGLGIAGTLARRRRKAA